MNIVQVSREQAWSLVGASIDVSLPVNVPLDALPTVVDSVRAVASMAGSQETLAAYADLLATRYADDKAAISVWSEALNDFPGQGDDTDPYQNALENARVALSEESNGRRTDLRLRRATGFLAVYGFRLSYYGRRKEQLPTRRQLHSACVLTVDAGLNAYEWVVAQRSAGVE